jgi:hypothetical protein
MGDRKRRGLAPTLEPMERRDVLSASILVALQPTNVPYLTPAQVAATAANQAQVSASATGGGATSSQNGLFIGNTGPNAAATFPASPIIGNGTPTAAELAREAFKAKFSGPLSTLPGRFSDQSKIIFMRGLGGSTPNFFLHGDYSLAIVIPTGFNPKQPAGTGGDPSAPGYVPPVTGFTFLDDKNNNSGGVVGLDLLADPTSFDSKGRPTRLTFTADPNIYGGIYFVDSASGVVNITYHKNTAQAVFDGRIYTSGLTSPFENVDLYKRGGRLTNRG